MGLRLREKIGIILLFGLTACGVVDQANQAVNPLSTPVPAAKLVTGAWMPDQTAIGSGSSNSKGTTALTTFTLSASNAPLVRFNDPWSGNTTLVDLGNFTASSDFGMNGSITLVAETVNYPLSGGAYPVLASFYVDTGSGTIEFVNTSDACSSAGMWTCNGGNCTANAACTVQTGTSFGGREDWDQHQVPPFGYSTTNAFPRCDSSVGSWTGCPANLSSLPSGHYYAKYVMMSDSGSSVASTTTGLKVTVSIKKDTASRNTGSTNGSVDVNLILVGDQNVNDSHSAAGARNLDMLFKEVNSILTTNVGIGIGAFTVYDWSDANGGNQYSNVDYSDLGILFSAGSQAVTAASAGKALNIFIVSDIAYSGASFTILGLSGGILGPTVNGTQSSGLAFSSNDDLAVFNATCSDNTCSRNNQDASFLEMAATIAHEMGHFLGLNHPSESKVGTSPQQNDQLNDTPTCLARLTSGSSYTLDQRACYQDSTIQSSSATCQSACDAAIGVGGQGYFNSGNNTSTPDNFCKTVTQCQFNHLMWYTTKNRLKMSGVWHEDGNLISPESSVLMQWDAFVR